jgi:hypothetical protein
VGTALVGERVDDDAMLELLEPYRGHRYRAVRMIEPPGSASSATGHGSPAATTALCDRRGQAAAGVVRVARRAFRWRTRRVPDGYRAHRFEVRRQVEHSRTSRQNMVLLTQAEPRPSPTTRRAGSRRLRPSRREHLARRPRRSSG